MNINNDQHLLDVYLDGLNHELQELAGKDPSKDPYIPSMQEIAQGFIQLRGLINEIKNNPNDANIANNNLFQDLDQNYVPNITSPYSKIWEGIYTQACMGNDTNLEQLITELRKSF